MGDWLDPRTAVIVLLIASMFWAGQQVWGGLKKVGCGLKHLVGKTCQPPTPTHVIGPTVTIQNGDQ